jgi:hypothetical protein
MKSLRELITGAKELDYVGEIIAGEVTEVAGVDRPATGRRWRFFKAGPGSKAGISPTLAPGANYTACLATGEQPTPTVCEASGEPDALGNFTDVLRADMAGHDASVADLKMLAEVEDAITRGELTFQEEKMITRGRKCPDGIEPEGKDVAPPVPEEMAGDVPVEDDQMAIEVPSTPTEWSLADCLTQATGMELPEDAAVQVCQMIRGDFGDPDDETKILVPNGTETEGLINSAAMSLGMGKSLKFQPTGPPVVKFKGENFWRKLQRRFLGIREPRPGRKLVEYLRGVESRVEGLMSEQSKMSQHVAAMLDQNALLIRTVAALAGHPIPATPAAETVQEPTPEAPAQGSGNPIMEPAKSAPTAPADGAKDGAAAGAPIPAAPTPDDRIARLEATVQELVAALTGGGPAMDEPGDNELPDLVGAGVAAPSAEPKRVSAATPPPNRLLQSKAAPASSGTPVEYSTILGAPVTTSERNAARNGGGLPRIARR